ncbi:Murein DD-endopeptidase MepM [compost metagenome]
MCLFAQQRDIRVYREFIEGKTVVFADNDEFCPVSVLMRTELENMKGSLKGIYVLVPAQTKRFVVTEISVINLKKKFNFKYQNSFYLGDINLKRYDVNFPYELPYKEGEEYLVGQGYNGKISHQNEFALDFIMPIGTEVLASRDGIVVDVQDKNTETCMNKTCAEFNNFVVIYHEDGTFAEYTHIDTNSALVKKGDVVKTGYKIALSGNIGWSSGPHLHFFTFVPNIEKGRISIRSKFKVAGNKLEFLKEKESYLKE